MIIKFKILPSDHNEWLGWFGNSLIKVRIDMTEEKDLEKAFLNFLQKDLGINKDNLKIIEENKDFLTIEFPDIAWELFLTVVK